MRQKAPVWFPVVFIFSVLSVFVSLVSCELSPGSGTRSRVSSYIPDIDTFITGHRYFVDPVTGNDTAGGNSAAPWKTLVKAQSVAKAGDAVYLRSGNYGLFSEQVGGRTGYVVFLNEEGAVPVFTGIKLDYQGENGNSYLVFYGITILPEWVAPGGDPQDPESTQTTYAKTANPVEIRYANHVQVFACDIGGQSKYLTDLGVFVYNSEYVTIGGSVIHDVHRGTNYDGSRFINYFGNHIHRIAGSAFKSADGSSTDILIEGNNAHDSNYDFADDYCPRAAGANYHGSAVAIRSDRVTIRNNVFHDGFNSSGLMTYDDDGPGSDIDYSDITIENNLLYDIRNSYVLRFYLLSSNIVIRNNTFVGHETGKSGARAYDTVVVLHTVAAGAGGDALTFDNNIVVGTADFSGFWGAINQHSNIYYSCLDGPDFLTQAIVGGGSMVATSTVTSDLFSTGFFVNPVAFSWNNDDPINPVGHHLTLGFTLAPRSPARGFGNQALQPLDGLGDLGDDGFITISPLLRSAFRHNAGAYP